MNRSKSNNGVTLIVLTITIIILMILVGVSVRVLINEKLLGRTKRTVYEANNITNSENTMRDNILSEWSDT